MSITLCLSFTILTTEHVVLGMIGCLKSYESNKLLLIMAKANHSLTPLKGHGRNLVQQLETKLLDSYNVLGYV